MRIPEQPSLKDCQLRRVTGSRRWAEWCWGWWSEGRSFQRWSFAVSSGSLWILEDTHFEWGMKLYDEKNEHLFVLIESNTSGLLITPSWASIKPGNVRTSGVRHLKSWPIRSGKGRGCIRRILGGCMFHGWGSGTFYIQSQSFCGIPDKFKLGERGRDNVKLFLVFLFSKGKSQNKTIWEGGSLFPPPMNRIHYFLKMALGIIAWIP